MKSLPVDSEWHELSSLLESAEGSLFLAEEYLVVRNKAGRLQPLKANKAQRLYEERRGRENIVLKARQMGMSTWIAGRFLLKTILTPGATSLMAAHTRESAESLFTVVMRMWENLPTAFRHHAGQPGRSNVGQITFPRIDSEFRIASASERNAGRGLSVHNLHCSEVARWDGDAAETLAGLRAALVPDGELVLESTPNGAYGCFHAEWQSADDNGMVRHFAPWWFEPAYVGAPATNYSEEEVLLAARAKLTAEQVGFRRELARRFGALRAQEFAEDPVSCFRASGSCFFDLEAVEKRMSDLPASCVSRVGKALHIWLPPVNGRAYIIAADAAGGGSAGDFAAVQVIDEGTGMQCAELQARLSPRELAHAAADLAREYNGALLVVERNNHGNAVLALLESEGGLNLYLGRDRMPGWLTDAASRPRMLQEFAKVLCQRPELIASERLLLECRSFAVDEHGRAAAARGSHDDLVMSMAIAHAVRSRC
jgi:hypothetical protein